MLSGELPRLACREHGLELRPELPPPIADPSMDRPGDRDLLRDLDEVEERLFTTSDIIGGCSPRGWTHCSLLGFSTEPTPTLPDPEVTGPAVRLRSRLALRRTVPTSLSS